MAAADGSHSTVTPALSRGSFIRSRLPQPWTPDRAAVRLSGVTGGED